MSDFLSREANLFGGEFGGTSNTSGAGGDEIDFERAASAFPDISLDGDIPSVPVPSQTTQSNSGGGFSFDSFDAPSDTGNVRVTGDDELEKFENQFPELEVPQQTSPPPSAPTFAPRPQPSALASTPILTQQIEEEEPQVIREWREKQQAEIQAREEAAKARRQETISKAERSIDEFYEEYAKKKERNIRENKDTEAEFLANQTSSLATGTTWERICDLIDLQNSQSKTLARTGAGTTDLTRFKEVLLRLKREGDNAPGAAGY
ncbi:clathrin light chain [Coprinopsis cinerea okayama7|uniref:Clathrin light chain n=1 Tax=Coprinopsis cinerea (strain Okayama-7 / 130 / ATCC MYA-4618 / FGSC 9003) TaxID=240176 RepID=A8N700_COPC7|nr:clathrin light chain [Coprinopsis cinerea okayama7\|eukprot:XP_001830606.1 clathrin light chain [Coprinopsis cinerea okayama7\